jgi:hypothetical protein
VCHRAAACSIAETRQLQAEVQRLLALEEVAAEVVEVAAAVARLSLLPEEALLPLPLEVVSWLSLLLEAEAVPLPPLEVVWWPLLPEEAWWPLALYQPPELAQYLPLAWLPLARRAESQLRPLNQRGFAQYLPLERLPLERVLQTGRRPDRL